MLSPEFNPEFMVDFQAPLRPTRMIFLKVATLMDKR
jgi:hypothetical protein